MWVPERGISGMQKEVDLESELIRPNLLPCPFCGEDEMSLHEYGFSSDDHDFYIQCKTCTTTGPNGDSIESAILQWNIRTKVSKPRMELFKKGGGSHLDVVKSRKCLKCDKKIMTTPENRLCSSCKTGGLFFGAVQEQTPTGQGKKEFGAD